MQWGKQFPDLLLIAKQIKMALTGDFCSESFLLASKNRPAPKRGQVAGFSLILL